MTPRTRQEVLKMALGGHSPSALIREYLDEYAAAVAYVSVQIWASIQRHDGDPCWEYNVSPGERRR